MDAEAINVEEDFGETRREEAAANKKNRRSFRDKRLS